MDEKQELLNKKYWHLNDICIFFECGRNKATAIRQKALREFDGFEPLFPQRVKTDSVLKAMNIKD